MHLSVNLNYLSKSKVYIKVSKTLADEDGRLRIVVNASLVAMVRLRFELLGGHDAQRRQSDQQDGSRNFDRVRHDPAAGKELNFASSHAGYIAIINGHRRAHLENESDEIIRNAGQHLRFVSRIITNQSTVWQSPLS